MLSIFSAPFDILDFGATLLPKELGPMLSDYAQRDPLDADHK